MEEKLQRLATRQKEMMRAQEEQMKKNEPGYAPPGGNAGIPK